MKSFQFLLSDFLLDYVPRRRGLSVNTVKSYRDCFVLLLTYMDACHSIIPDRIDIGNLSRDRLESFLIWLTEARHASPSTVNNRLAALRAFAEYISFTEPRTLIGQSR